MEASKKKLAAPKKMLVRQLKNRRTLSILIPAVFLLLLVVSVLTVQTVTSPKGNTGKPVSAKEYQKSLKGQVDNQDGSPISGRDPSSQAQTSLAAAAATPSGTGTHTDKPAAGVTGTTGSKASPDQVYTPDQQKTGINDAGCFYDYGRPGQDCVPSHLANDSGALVCDGYHGVRSEFPNGVKVSGTDRFHLDKNGDGTACGAGD